MPDVLVRGLREETHASLKRRAKEHGRSVNAEMLALLEATVEPKKRVGLGTEIRRLVKKFGGYDLEIERDQTPARVPDFD